MPALSDYTAGTITLTNGSTAFTGAGTGWLAADFREGDTIFQVSGQTQWDAVIESITSNTSGVLVEPWGGATGTYPYRMRYMADGARVTAQARNLIELLGNGNALALAGLTGPGVVVFNGPHSMVVKPESDFVNGVFFNISVATFADRAAYDTQPGPVDNAPGYTVLVLQDVNFDNKTTLYSKLSDTSGDWSSAAIITGDVGEMPTLEVGTTDTLPPGSNATVDVNPVVGGYELDFGIPEGRGAKYVPGGYNALTAYTLDQSVLDNGSTWILTVASSTGNAPPVLPVTSNAWWSLLARAGTDGAGTGDVVGPSGVVDGEAAVFDGTTGKLIKSGKVFAGRLPEAARTANLTVTTAHAGIMQAFNSATPLVATLPPIALSNGEKYPFMCTDVGSLTIDPNAAELVDGAATLVLTTGMAVDIWPNAAKTAWRAFVYAPAADYLAKSQNLADVPNKVTARTNLGLSWETVVNEPRSAVAAINLIGLTNYRRLRGKMFIRPSASSGIQARFSDTNGASYYSGASDYRNSYLYGIAGATAFQEDEDAAVSSIRVGGTGATGFSGQGGVTIDFEVDRMNEAATWGWLTYRFFAFTSTSAIALGQGGGHCKITAAFNAIQFFPTSGTISYCDLEIEGLR